VSGSERINRPYLGNGWAFLFWGKCGRDLRVPMIAALRPLRRLQSESADLQLLGANLYLRCRCVNSLLSGSIGDRFN
jgi:hypothetical protein